MKQLNLAHTFHQVLLLLINYVDSNMYLSELDIMNTINIYKIKITVSSTLDKIKNTYSFISYGYAKALL